MEFLSEYGLFLAKTVTIVAAILIVMAAGMASAARQKKDIGKGTISVTHLNKEYDKLKDAVRKAVTDEARLKLDLKSEKKKAKAEKKAQKETARQADADADGKKHVFVIDFDGDPKASQVDELRHTVTAILAMARPEHDEIVVRLESPGGHVHAYGLAASQLNRIRTRNIPLVISVDKVAASGGYLMACLGNRILAAPFAYIGSIGVLVQLPNFNRLLKEKNIDYEMVTSGEFKRTLTVFGENTEKGRDKVQEDVKEVHEQFKDHIKTFRASLDIEKFATGEVWLGTKARELGLVDEVMTSDEYLVNAVEHAEVYVVTYEKKKKITEKLGTVMESVLDNTLLKWLHRSTKSDYLS